MIAVVVVTWNSGQVIGACLDACLAMGDTVVVVVDNASEDNTIDIVSARSGVRLIANSTNRGFAGAVNQGVAAVPDAQVVLLVNPDAVPVSGVDALVQAALRPNTGVVGGRLIGRSGEVQQGFQARAFPGAWTLAFEVLGLNKLWPGNPVNRRYRTHVPEGSESVVDQPAGAFVAFRREHWTALGGFDESFHPVWFEDVDFCLRLSARGYTNLHVPQAVAKHWGGHSADLLDSRSRRLCWYGSLLTYTRKHLSGVGYRGVILAVMAGCIPKMLIAMARQRGSQAWRVYGEVFRLAARRLFASTSTPVQVRSRAPIPEGDSGATG